MKAKSANELEQQPHPRNEAAQKPGDREKRAWLRLIRTSHIGTITFWELLAQCRSAEAALAALPDFAKFGRLASQSIPPWAAIDDELEKAHAGGMKLVAVNEEGYPPLLAHAGSPPPLLYIKGNPRIWERPPIAIVGSRQASAAGIKLAGEISADLGQAGFLVVSGLARGIDAAAHRGSLPFGTCAVLAGGLDAVYPPEHSDLAEEIAQTGILISECPPGFVARAQDFPRRNRIISGSCLGVLVVEAAERSGSLITARLAGEQNREVFAVPGHPLEPRASGTNRLLKEGAILTTGAKDIQETLQPILRSWAGFGGADGAGSVNAPIRQSAPVDGPNANMSPGSPQRIADFDFLDEARKRIVGLLSLSAVHVDELCRLSGIESKEVHAALVSLDLEGRIERHGSGYVALRP